MLCTSKDMGILLSSLLHSITRVKVWAWPRIWGDLLTLLRTLLLLLHPLFYSLKREVFPVIQCRPNLRFLAKRRHRCFKYPSYPAFARRTSLRKKDIAHRQSLISSGVGVSSPALLDGLNLSTTPASLPRLANPVFTPPRLGEYPFSQRASNDNFMVLLCFG
jgi:hypothetical protein